MPWVVPLCRRRPSPTGGHRRQRHKENRPPRSGLSLAEQRSAAVPGVPSYGAQHGRGSDNSGAPPVTRAGAASAPQMSRSTAERADRIDWQLSSLHRDRLIAANGVGRGRAGPAPVRPVPTAHLADHPLHPCHKSARAICVIRGWRYLVTRPHGAAADNGAARRRNCGGGGAQWRSEAIVTHSGPHFRRSAKKDAHAHDRQGHAVSGEFDERGRRRGGQQKLHLAGSISLIF